MIEWTQKYEEEIMLVEIQNNDKDKEDREDNVVNAEELEEVIKN